MAGPLDYRRLFEATPTPYLILDRFLKIVAVNDVYLAATMTVREQILGRHLFAVFPDNPDDPEASGVNNLAASLRTVLETATPDVMAVQKYAVRRPDGTFEERHWSPVNTPILAADGTVDLIVHRVEDVTEFVRMGTAQRVERQNADELLRRTETMEAELFTRAHELQELNRNLRHANAELAETTGALAREQEAKDNFLGALSHELRNPLAAILGALEVIKDPVRCSAEQRQEMLVLIGEQVDALRQMTDDLLDVTRARVGKLRLQSRTLDMGKLLTSVLESVRTGSDLADRTLSADLPGEPAWVKGDATRLSQAIGNLLTNAVKFTRPEGTITASLRQAGAQVIVEVRDDGQGFDPERAEELFEPFSQQDDSLARATTGLGLGLAIIREIVGLHGGEVSARSRGPGLGASFTITLPAAAPPPPRPAAAAPADSHSEPKRILLIEDNEAVAATYERLLARMGHETIRAADGNAGVEAARNELPDIVICDIGLPDLDGFEVAGLLRADPATGRIPLVALSGYGDPGAVRQAIGAGFDRHITKPATAATLENAISAVFRAAER